MRAEVPLENEVDDSDAQLTDASTGSQDNIETVDKG